ncbi:MAG: hypothetical protein QOG72_2429 [Sphingomonadales bacterium]|jgi:hypothetical protein|nr:hypothetical protein [Sphingomonadales bacterium]
MNETSPGALRSAPEAGQARCAACRYFDKQEAGHRYGDCRRLPPQFNFSAHFKQEAQYGEDPPRMTADITRFQNGVWPNVHQDEWCGEFRPLHSTTLERKP